ncbi:MAG: NFACT family protein [Fervidobacterium sp.]|uniref:Rqc2 homolog RqcH n=1 Tax=Fervidobacterium gondwanense DSM 13020 TaxID=1121883 RepID=A0A1M7RRC5_FERGO|nr:NFACT family protein [Fervidobacterium gondwanense]UXF00382.1 fibronectin-binding protein [Fervidobacterium riparium]SHN48618.1 Predicted component of the ribosome quality control (RQC) complex, YloA/Tae2 family, contains fibronectin-binding (FbpA) and DUF814 domains [Fervidobacterium gondwanense DSM 13020]
MAFDGFVMRITAGKIEEHINGLNLRNIYLEDKVLYFSFDAGDLKISLNPNFAHISFTEHIVKEPEKQTFVDFLRSRIRGAKVSKFSSIGYDRTVVLELKKTDEIGQKHEYKLYIDIMGKHSNVILVENGVILDAYKRIETRFRNINPGEKFVLFASNKMNIEEVTADSLSVALEHFPKQKAISEFIYSTIQGFSRLTAEELLFRADLDDMALSQISDEHLNALLEAIASIRRELSENQLYVYYENDMPIDISVFRLHKYTDFKRCENPVECVNEYFEFVEKKDKLTQKKNQLLSIVNSKIEAYEKLIDSIEKEVEECKNAEKYRKFGELLKAYSYQIGHGLEEVTLTDWETNEEVRIPLEKHLSAIENSVKYFKMYNKLKKKLEGLSERKEILERELSYLRQLQNTIENAETLDDLLDIEEEMVEGELIKKHKGKKNTKVVTHSEPRRYTFNGFTIFVGRNNRQNDELVRKASEHDLWLHVQGMPGAHVVVKTNGKPIDDETLQYAAKLAAYYSKGKYSTKVPVDYTQVKYVKKPRGFKPGLVLYSNFKTLFVTPTE